MPAKNRHMIIEKSTYFVGIFHDQVLALLLFHTCVNDAAHDTPSIVHVEVDLLCKLCWPKLLRAKNDMLGRVSDMNARYVTAAHTSE